MARSSKGGHELRLVGAQGDVAVRAPPAAVEHDHGGESGQRLGERGGLFGDVAQLPVRQLGAGLGYSRRLARGGQDALLASDGLGDSDRELPGGYTVMMSDLLADGERGVHGDTSGRDWLARARVTEQI